MFAFLFGATAAAAFANLDFAGGHFVDVGVLVGTEQYFLAAGYIGVTLFARFVYCILHLAFSHELEEAALGFGIEEEFPCFAGDGYGEGFDIVTAACGVDNLVEVAFFLKQELLVACYALAESVRSLIGNVERSGGDRVDTCKCCRHRFGLAAEQVHVSVVYSLVEA